MEEENYFTLIPEQELETELLSVSENEFEESLNDTIAENDGFVAPNHDNFINSRIGPFHNTDQVWKNIGDPSTARILSHGPENPVGAGRLNI